MDYCDYDPTAAVEILPHHIQKNLSHLIFIAAWIEELGLAPEACQRQKASVLSLDRKGS